MINIIGISRFVRNDICKRTALIRVLARSPSGQRGNLPELKWGDCFAFDSLWELLGEGLDKRGRR